MIDHLHFSRILVLLLTNACTTKSTFVQNVYTALKRGQDLTGEIIATHTAHKIDCSLR